MQQAHRVSDELTVDQWILSEARKPANWLKALGGALVAYIFIVMLFLS